MRSSGWEETNCGTVGPTIPNVVSGRPNPPKPFLYSCYSCSFRFVRHLSLVSVALKRCMGGSPMPRKRRFGTGESPCLMTVCPIFFSRILCPLLMRCGQGVVEGTQNKPSAIPCGQWPLISICAISWQKNGPPPQWQSVCSHKSTRNTETAKRGGFSRLVSAQEIPRDCA